MEKVGEVLVAEQSLQSRPRSSGLGPATNLSVKGDLAWGTGYPNIFET